MNPGRVISHKLSLINVILSIILHNTKKLNIDNIKFVLFLCYIFHHLKRINMTDAEKTVIVKKPTKKETRKEVFEKLSGALAEYKSKLDEKKFENNLKKASKLFAVDIVKAIKKDGKKRPAKKTSDKT